MHSSSPATATGLPLGKESEEPPARSEMSAGAGGVGGAAVVAAKRKQPPEAAAAIGSSSAAATAGVHKPVGEEGEPATKRQASACVVSVASAAAAGNASAKQQMSPKPPGRSDGGGSSGSGGGGSSSSSSSSGGSSSSSSSHNNNSNSGSSTNTSSTSTSTSSRSDSSVGGGRGDGTGGVGTSADADVGGKESGCQWFLFHGMKSIFGNGIIGTALAEPGWVELTDMNIAAAAAVAGTPEAMYYQSPKCLFSLILQPSAELRQKFLCWGPIRAYLVLKLVNLDNDKESFAPQQPLVPMDTWGYYWEKCTIDAQQVHRDDTGTAAQVNFSRDQNYHPYVELTGKCDVWLTVWFREQVAPCFFELRLEDGSRHVLRVPFLASTGDKL